MEINTQPKRIAATLLVCLGAVTAYYQRDFFIFMGFIFGIEWGIITIVVNARKGNGGNYG